MAKMPSYQQSVGVQPAPLGDAGAGQAAWGRALTGIGSKFIGLADVLGKDSNRQSQLLARADTLSSLQGQEQDISKQAFEKGRQDAMEPVAQMQIKGSVANFAHDAFSNGLSLDTFAQFDKSVDGLKQGVAQNYPSAMHPFLNNVTDYYVQNAKNLMASQFDKQTQNTAQATFLSFVNSNEQDIENANSRGNFDAAEAFTGQTLQKARQAVEQGLLTPVEFGNISQRIKYSAVESYYLGGLQQSMTNGTTEKFLSDFQKADINLSPQQKFQLETKMQSVIAMQRRQLALNGINLDSQMKDALKVMQQYGNPALIENTRSMVARYAPEKIDEFNKEADLAKTQYTVLNAVKDVSPQAFNTVLGSIDTKISEAKASGDNESLLFFTDLKSQAAKAYTQSYQKGMEDPYAEFMQSSDYVHTLQAQSTLAVDNKGNRVAVANGPVNPNMDEAAINHFKMMGRPQGVWSLLTKDQATNAMKQINSLPVADQPAAVAKLLSSHQEKYWPYILAPLRKAGLKASTYMMVGMLNNPVSRAFVPQVAQAMTVSDKDMGLEQGVAPAIHTAVDRELNSFYQSAGGYNNLKNNPLGDVRSMIIKYASYLVSSVTNPSGNLSASDAAEQATQAIIGSRYQFVPVYNSMLRIPNNVISNDQALTTANQMYNYLDKGELSIPQNYKEEYLAGLTPSQQQGAYQAYIRSTGKLITSGDDKSMMLVVNGNPVKIKTEGGAIPLQVDFSDIANPAASVNQILKSSKERRNDLFRNYYPMSPFIAPTLQENE